MGFYDTTMSTLAKACVRKKLNGERGVRYSILDSGDVAFTADGICAYVIPAQLVFIDLAKLETASFLKSVFCGDNDVKPLTFQRASKMVCDKEAEILKTHDDKEVLLSRRLLRQYGKPSELKYEARKENSAVIIYDKNDVLLGCLMPLRGRA